MASVTLAAVGLSACAAALTDDVTVASLANDRKGSVLMLVDSSVDDCNGVIAKIGRRQGQNYEVEWSWIVKGNGKYSDKPMILEPGEYHVNGFVCSKSLLSAVEIGPIRKNALTVPTGFASYGSFKLEPGEVLNAGLLLVGDPPKNRMLEVRDLPPEVHASLKSSYPKLYPQMKKRLMHIDREKTRLEEVASPVEVVSNPNTASSMPIFVPSYRRR